MVDLPDCRAQLRMMRFSVEVRRSRCQGSGAMPNDLANATGSRGILVSLVALLLDQGRAPADKIDTLTIAVNALTVVMTPP
jgi:hypothetical protein